MAHDHKEYLDEICKAIEELAMLKPTAERARCMHDYLYIKKHFTEYAEHKDMARDMGRDDAHKSYFGG